MRILASIAALTGLCQGVVPHFSLKAVQPLFDDIYGVAPRIGVGIAFPQSSNFAFRTELTGLYGTGRPGFSSYHKLGVMARAAEQVNLRPVLDAYLDGGVMYAYARECQPYADTNGVITYRWGSGSAMGLFAEGGAILARSSRLRLDFEVGLDLVAIQTDLQLPGRYPSYSTVSLSGLSAGFVLSLVQP
ncbi:MAG: hypothetical protein ABIK43_01605 [candidate division WOR-3 bacterium]